MERNHIQILYFVIIISLIIISSSILFLSFSYLSFAQRENDNENDDDEDKGKLVVRSHINLQNVNLEKTKFIRVIGFINGEEVKEDIPISSIDKNKKTLNVDL